MSTIESPVVLSDYDWLFKMDEDAVRKRATAWKPIKRAHLWKLPDCDDAGYVLYRKDGKGKGQPHWPVGARVFVVTTDGRCFAEGRSPTRPPGTTSSRAGSSRSTCRSSCSTASGPAARSRR